MHCWDAGVLAMPSSVLVVRILIMMEYVLAIVVWEAPTGIGNLLEDAIVLERCISQYIRYCIGRMHLSTR